MWYSLYELQELCKKTYPKCEKCPFYKNDCKWMDDRGIEHVLPKDWNEDGD